MKNGNINDWFNDNGDYTLRLDYELDQNSTVFDLGGYHGEWSDKIFKKFGCEIYIFEPIKPLYESIVKKFMGNEKIKVYNFAISDVDEKRLISIENDASSFYKNKGNQLECQVISITNFLTREKLDNIDLIKINVEGDEFKILPKILSDNLINLFKNIQVQFHDFYPNSKELRLDIHNKLSQTHHLTYNYEFVWENWKKNV